MILASASATPARHVRLAALVAAAALASAARAQTCDPATSAAGAHPSHTFDGRSRAALACVECHAPACAVSPGATVVFGALASSAGATPRWDAASRTCSGVYCHGATIGGPGAPVAWAYVDPARPRPPAEACGACHGYPPASHPPGSSACGDCHAPSVNADGTIDLAGGHHVDGGLDFTGGGTFSCDRCHASPPADAAHLAHFGLAGAASPYGDTSTLEDRFPAAAPWDAPAVYAFGCGSCHPSDAARHRDGAVQVEVRSAAAPAGSLKARAAPGAAWDPATGTCSGVYCHSSGQAEPAFATTPPWRSGARVGCAGCHGNPPAYPSGGAGAVTANSHLNLADDGYEFGHFLGMPGPWHTSKHGGNWSAADDAAPITCQTCHFETTDPANTGPGGFYYLDTTGDYALPGGDPGRRSWWLPSIQCAACHGPGGAATGAGKALPLRHVNGRRDVAFDPRPTLPALAWLPPAPNTPTAPYWITDPGLAGIWPPNVLRDGATVSFDLGAAAYDPATKSCAGVACHVAEARPVWGRPYRYYTEQSATCYTCHPL